VIFYKKLLSPLIATPVTEYDIQLIKSFNSIGDSERQAMVILNVSGKSLTQISHAIKKALNLKRG
jgi:hypothetical protein